MKTLGDSEPQDFKAVILAETNSSPLKIDGWMINLSFGARPIVGYVTC